MRDVTLGGCRTWSCKPLILNDFQYYEWIELSLSINNLSNKFDNLLALVTSAVSAQFFVLTALCVRLLSRCCFGFCVQAVGTRVLGRVPISWVGWRVLPFSPQPNPAVKRDAALKRVAPYFCRWAAIFENDERRMKWVTCKDMLAGNSLVKQKDNSVRVRTIVNHHWCQYRRIRPWAKNRSGKDRLGIKGWAQETAQWFGRPEWAPPRTGRRGRGAG